MNYPTYIPMQQPAMQPMMQRPAMPPQPQPMRPMYGGTPPVIRVNGRPGADAFMLGPNEEVILLDANEDIFYYKATDGGGWGGGFGGFGGGGFVNGALTRAELYDGFAMQNIDSAVRGVQQGICDSTYALNNAITSGFYGVDRGLCDIGHQISDCCCTTQRNIDSVRYDMATGFCNLNNTIQNTTRDIIDNQNANYRGIMDFMVQEKLAGQAAEIAALKGALGRAEDRSFLTANQDAQTAEFLRRLGRDCPVPAYVVPNPNCCYGNPVGIGYGYSGGNGCGCGC